MGTIFILLVVWILDKVSLPDSMLYTSRRKSRHQTRRLLAPGTRHISSQNGEEFNVTGNEHVHVYGFLLVGNEIWHVRRSF